jgi:acyl-coenzyme A synthetase/AMP-(fatty) acid ligase
MPDVIELIGERTFKWIGRQQDMIKIGGKRGSLNDLNRRLALVDGVVDGVVFQPQEEARLAALVVAPGLTAADIRAALQPQVDSAFIPRPIFLVDGLPRQETGKLARSAIIDLFESARSRQSRKR